MPRLLAVLAPIAATAAHASAHFPFVVPDQGGATARVVMSETMTPDEDVSIGILSGATFVLRDGAGQETPLSASKGEHWLTLALPGSGPRLVRGEADLGVTKRGAGAPYVLVYHAKTIVGDPFAGSTILGAKTPVELVPMRTDDGFKLKLLVNGQPAGNRELRVITIDEIETDVTTDAAGLTPSFAESGRYAAWARHWVDEKGERDGKPYEQVRHYATLVFDFAGSSASVKTSAAPAPVVRARLPEAVASFGAVASDGWLYVYGGHKAMRHDYSTASVSARFHRLNLRDLGSWEELPSAVGVQGMNLAAHRGKIYRVGGMEPRNAPGAKADNHSIADVACYDPAVGAWKALPPLAKPRSSHDLIVVGDQLLVIGGWYMKGRGAEAEWLDTVEVLDLASPDAKWTSIPQPFQRRALITAALGTQVFVMGGFDADDEPQLDVDVLDVASKTWRKGPSIPGDYENGFAPAACTLDGTIYLSVKSGALYRLGKDQAGWEPFAQTTPRIVHRLIPSGTEILVVGGAQEAQMLDLIEAVPTSTGGAIASEVGARPRE